MKWKLTLRGCRDGETEMKWEAMSFRKLWSEIVDVSFIRIGNKVCDCLGVKNKNQSSFFKSLCLKSWTQSLFSSPWDENSPEVSSQTLLLFSSLSSGCHKHRSSVLVGGLGGSVVGLEEQITGHFGFGSGLQLLQLSALNWSCCSNWLRGKSLNCDFTWKDFEESSSGLRAPTYICARSLSTLATLSTLDHKRRLKAKTESVEDGEVTFEEKPWRLEEGMFVIHPEKEWEKTEKPRTDE